MRRALSGLRPHLTYANVTATIALVLTVGGASAYAASQLPDRSVGAAQLRPGAVTASKLRKNAVIGQKIKAKAIVGAKLATGAVKGEILAPSAVSAEKIAPAAITHEKIATDAITGDQVVESTLAQVPSAKAADSAVTAASANPVAFARVDGAGNLDLGLSKGLSQADVTRTATGAYCVTAQGFSPRGAQVSAEDASNGSITAYVKVNGAGGCPFPKVAIRTYNAAVAADEAFYLVLYG